MSNPVIDFTPYRFKPTVEWYRESYQLGWHIEMIVLKEDDKMYRYHKHLPTEQLPEADEAYNLFSEMYQVAMEKANQSC